VRRRTRVLVPAAMATVALLACGGALLPGVASAQAPVPPGGGTTTAPAAPTTAAPAPTVAPTVAPVIPVLPTVAPAPVGPTPEELAAQAAAAEAARQAQLEAERQAKALAAAQKAAEQLAAAGVRAKATWQSHGQPKKLIIVRATSVDTVADGQIQKHSQRRGLGALSLGDLTTYVPASWLSVEGGKARLSAMVVLSKGATLDIGAGSVTDVALVGGDTPDEAPSIFTGGGRLVVHDTAIGSRDPSSGTAMQAGPARPYIVVSGGGAMDATDATFSDLGTPGRPTGEAGISFNRAATGSLVRTQVIGGSTGLRLQSSDGVKLDQLTVARSAEDGIVLAGDKGTALSAVKAEGNGGTGVTVTGEPTDRPITGISTSQNALFGVVVSRQTAPQIFGITTTKDGLGGLRINNTAGAQIHDITVKDEQIGVFTHVSSSNVTMEKVSITGGRRGLVVEKTTKGLVLKDSTITGSNLGVAIGGHDVTLQDVTVTDAGTGVAAIRGSGNVNVNGLKLVRGKDGFVANTGTSGVVLRDVNSSGVANTAVRMLGDGGQIVGGQISGSNTGIHLESATTMTDTLISNVDTGIRVRNQGPYRAEKVSVDAVSVGVDVAPGAQFVLAASRVHALESIRGTVVPQGTNDLSLPALSLLGAIGVPLIALALLLELVHWVRLRKRTGGREIRRTPPPLPA
jgi:hypothetical protein